MALSKEGFSQVAGNLVSGLLNISSKVIIGVMAFLIAGGFIYYFVIYRRQFNIKVKVVSERASDPNIMFDKAAMLKDRKTGTKFIRLLNLKVELPVPPFKIMEKTNEGDYIEIYRVSEDEFRYLTRPRIDRERIIKADGKVYPVNTMKQRQMEGDLYWISKRREENKKLLDPDTIWAKLLAWAPQIVSSVFLLIILWIFMDKLPGLINNLVELTKEMKSLKGATVITGS